MGSPNLSPALPANNSSLNLTLTGMNSTLAGVPLSVPPGSGDQSVIIQNGTNLSAGSVATDINATKTGNDTPLSSPNTTPVMNTTSSPLLPVQSLPVNQTSVTPVSTSMPQQNSTSTTSTTSTSGNNTTSSLVTNITLEKNNTSMNSSLISPPSGNITQVVVPVSTSAPVMNATNTNGTSGSVNLTPLPGFSVIPRDLNGDGRYEDLNGNGVVDLQDPTLFFNNFDWIKTNLPNQAFDFNGNGVLDYGDINVLFKEASG